MLAAEISATERESADAWPCLQQAGLGGWILRSANGFTGRANTVYPLASPGMPLEPAVNHVRAWYRERGVKPGFKLTESSVPSGLDNYLEDHGFLMGHGAVVMTKPLEDADEGGDASVLASPSDEWLDVYLSANNTDNALVPTIRTMLSNIQLPRAFGSCLRDGWPVTCAMGVIANTTLWLFDIATLPGYRRRGLAQDTLQTLFAWAASQGATRAALQVVPANDPAIRLYRRLGFEERYSYWYRFGDQSERSICNV